MGCVQHIIIIELLLNLQRFFSMTNPCEFHNPYSWKLGSYLLTAWEIGLLSFLMITFQKDGAQVLEKDISWVVKVARGCEKIYLHFKMAEKELTLNSKFSKVNAVRQGRSGA